MRGNESGKLDGLASSANASGADAKRWRLYGQAIQHQDAADHPTIAERGGKESKAELEQPRGKRDGEGATGDEREHAAGVLAQSVQFSVWQAKIVQRPPVTGAYYLTGHTLGRRL